MINSLTRSTAFQITKSQLHHVKKLGEINSAKTTFLDFQYNPQLSLKQSRKRHARSRSFKNSQQKRTLKMGNRKLVMSMVKIAGRDLQFPITEKEKKHGSNYYQQQKRKKNIQRQNFTIANRILAQKSQFSQRKDKKQFHESRERLKRLEKFNSNKKIMELTKVRLLSQPATREWIDTKKKILNLYRHVQTQT